MPVSEQIISVLDNLCEKFGVAIDWSQQNIMPYLQELMAKYIRYEIITSVAWCLVCVALCFSLFKFAVVLSKKAHSTLDSFDSDIASSLLWVVFAVSAAISIIAIICQIFDIITCITFPEIIIVDCIKRMT